MAFISHLEEKLKSTTRNTYSIHGLRRIAESAFIALIILFASSSLAHAAPADDWFFSESFPIAVGEAVQFMPAVEGDFVIYKSNDDLYGIDIAGNGGAQLLASNLNQQLANLEIKSKKAIFQRYNGGREFCSKDLSIQPWSQENLNCVPSSSGYYISATDDGTGVYYNGTYGYSGAGGIYFVNFNAGTVSTVSTNMYTNTPFVSDVGAIWKQWQGFEGRYYEQVVKRGSENLTGTGCGSNIGRSNPRAVGGVVFYDRVIGSGDWDIVKYTGIPDSPDDEIRCSETTLAGGAGDQQFSQLANYTDQNGQGHTLIVFEDSRNGDWDIYLKDLSTNQETAVCQCPGDQRKPDITLDSEGQPFIVWEDYRDNNWDIYGARATTAQKIADKFKPYLYLHPDEHFEPRKIDIMTAGDGTRLMKNNDGQPQVVTMWPYLTPTVLGNYNTASDQPADVINGKYLDLAGSTKEVDEAKGDGPSKFEEHYLNRYRSLVNSGNFLETIYAHVYLGGDGKILIQYWLPYYFNDFGNFTRFGNFHEGDWEHIDVFLDGNLEPAAAGISQHETGKKRIWEFIEGPEGHPYIYAARGSHANYFFAGSHDVHAGIATDETKAKDGDDPLLKPFVTVLPDVSSSDTTSLVGTPFYWLAYQGAWGELTDLLGGDGPQGPASIPDHSSVWDDPFSWFVNDSDWDGEPPPVDHPINSLFASVASPVDIHLYDAQGRHVGKNAMGGYDQQIPGSQYIEIPELHRKTIMLPGADMNDGYRFVLDGTGTGTFDLTVSSPDKSQNNADRVEHIAVPVTGATVAEMVIDQNKDYSLIMDADGDGISENQRLADSVTGLGIDLNPPGNTGDLAVEDVTSDSVTLAFTAPGDDGNAGIAQYYDIRYAQAPITKATWKDATPIQFMPVPQPAGNTETVLADGLAADTSYYFALKAIDEVGQFSQLSNVTVATTKLAQQWSPWSSRTLNTESSAALESPNLLQLANGQTLLTYAEDGTPSLIKYKLTSDGNTWGQPLAIVGSDGGQDPSAAQALSGKVVVAYASSSSVNPELKSIKITTSDNLLVWSPPEEIVASQTQSARNPSIASLENGDLLLTYTGGSEGGQADIFSVYGSFNGSSWAWGAPVLVHQGTSETANSSDPSLINLGGGELLVAFSCGPAFTDRNGWGDRNIHAVRSSDSGATWDSQNPITIYASTGPADTQPALARLKNGDILAAFATSEDGSLGNLNIKSLRSTDGGATWSSAETVSTGPESESHPATAQRPNGAILSVWDSDPEVSAAPYRLWLSTKSDVVAPVTRNILPSGIISDNQTAISVDYSDDGAGANPAAASVSLDGVVLSGCTATDLNISCPVSNLSLGTHNFDGSVSDYAGNNRTFGGSFTVADTAPPQVGSVGPEGTIYSDSATITGAFSDDLSGIDPASVRVYLNDALLAGCNATATGVSCPVTALAYGPHRITGSVSDNAGNTSAITGTFLVEDNVAPALSGLQPAGIVAASATTISADFADPDPSSGIDAGSVSASLNGSPLTGCAVTSGRVSCPVSGLGEGGQSFQVSLTDRAGNTSTSAGSFTVDTVAPTVYDLFPAGFIRDSQATISAGYSDATAGVNPAAVSVTLDGSVLPGCTASESVVSCPVSNLYEGGHSFQVGVTDHAGHTGVGVGSFTVDTVVPAIMSVEPAGMVLSDSPTITATFADAAPSSGISPALVSVSLDGNVLSGCSTTSTSVSCPVLGLSQGSHNLHVSVSDGAGNNTYAIDSFIVDTVAPTLGDLVPGGFINGNSPTISASYSDQTSGVNTAAVTVKLDGGALSGCVAAETSVSCATSALGEGAHSLQITAADNAGNPAIQSGSFVIDTVAPLVTDVQPSGAVSGDSPTITASFADAAPSSGTPPDLVSVSLDGNALLSCSVTSTSVSCPVSGLPGGLHTIGGSVLDNAGNVSQISGSFFNAALAPGVISIISSNSAGTPGNATSNNANPPALSADSRYTAFTSSASNLVAGDANNVVDIFVKNNESGAISRASTSSAGDEANAGSYHPAISTDGRYVAFASQATNLVSGDTNGMWDVFVKDTLSGQLTRVSTATRDSDGNEFQANGASLEPAISADGRYVAFESAASNLLSDISFSFDNVNIYLKDTQTGQTRLVSSDNLGVEAHLWDSDSPDISADGRHVVFHSYAILTTDCAGGYDGIYVKDMNTGGVACLSPNTNGESSSPAISADGRYAVYSSLATNLVDGDTNAQEDVFRVNIQGSLEVTRVSTGNDGSQAQGASTVPEISADGRYVAFSSEAGNLMGVDALGSPVDGNGVKDVLRKDTLTGEVRRYSTASGELQANGASDLAAISEDGFYVAFLSRATNLVSLDGNNTWDVFLSSKPGPALAISLTRTYWADYLDYVNGVLSVEYQARNLGSKALNVRVIAAENTDGVSVNTPLPYPVATQIDTWQTASFSLKYNIPVLVFGFDNRVQTAQEDLAGKIYYSEDKLRVGVPAVP